MATISTAVGVDRVSRASGYKLKKGFFTNDTPNLPQRIAIFAEANTANQAGLTTTKQEVTSAKEAAELYGYGSPIHRIMRILRPVSGDGVGGIPTVVFPQITAGGATATVRAWTVTGTATANATHYLIVNGRDTLDFQTHAYNIVAGDTPTVIAGKMSDAMNSVLGSPAIGTSALGVATFTTKWAGVTSAEFNVTIDTGGVSAGVSYSQTTSTDGTGVVDLAASLSQFGDDWYTIVVNSYGTAQFASLEAFNGVPDSVNPTGRYSGLIFKPFLAFWGSTESDKDDVIAITDAGARVEQVTNVLAPAPNSLGFSFEAAANMVALFAPVAQNTPHLDVNALSYPDMPVPSNLDAGDFKDYDSRDAMVKKGASTVLIDNGVYKVQDLVTSYHPDGESPLIFSYARNLNIDFNVRYQYGILENRFLKDKALVSDNQTVGVSGVIKPKEWKGIVFDLFDNLASSAMVNDSQFSKDSLLVQISTINPNRFETFFRYKRTGIARIESTDVEAGY